MQVEICSKVQGAGRAWWFGARKSVKFEVGVRTVPPGGGGGGFQAVKVNGIWSGILFVSGG